MTRRRTARPTPAIEALLLGLSAFLLATANGRFWTTLLQGRDLAAPATLGVIAAVGAMVLAIHFALPELVSTRRTVRPVATLLIVFAASASFYAQRYGTLIDPSMIRNVLATDTREAGELLSVDLVVHALLYGALPIAAVWWCQPRTRGWRRGLPIRFGAIALALVVGVGALFAVFQDFASTMRNQKSLRYAITPANVVWSLGSVGATAAAGGVAKREPPDPAARVAREGRRPTLLVVVVGETVRAANWPANGYARPTTPELAARTDVTHFTKAAACGTSTEVSVPCMFSPHGRADYDESRIRLTDSALHVIARAGVQVLWRDNQAGCGKRT